MKLRNIYQKLKAWYRGENTPLSLEQIFNSVKQSRRYLESKEPAISDMLKPPLIARSICFLWQFWLRRWPILLPIIVGAIIALFIHFDSKPDSKPPQKHDRMPTVHADK